jgi:DNA-directed RNA polymerase subunit beta'
MIVNEASEFDHLEIGLASPDRIRFWSYGEIEKPETINYRTFKPERKGLFCEKIFGPVKDWECSCGKYRRVRYRGIVCERCGVEVTHSKVRRERMGHLELASPVTHIWFLKGIPSYIGLLLDMPTRHLEEIIYYDSYVITRVSDDVQENISLKQLISLADYQELRDKYGDKLKVDIGASAIKTLLSDLNLESLILELREALGESKGQKRLKITKRLRILESLCKSGNRPEWMILDVVPVMPPDLRPMVQLEGGRFATSDLNDLYRRVVNRNNRLKRLMDIGAPEMIVRNEKRMLQEAVDVLISNGKRGRSVTGSNGRPLKSLGNIIEGKQGRFRQNLLGKRVDYSARSVIVVGPHLKFHQCGLPKEMALELFKPFVIRKLVEQGIVSNVKSAKRKIEKREVEIWAILESVIRGQQVLLNRAPTLHRLGIQAFEPVLVEGSAIQVHPLVCTAFNADFDGDQMAVHVPLSVEAQAECRLLILATNNILSPSSGRAIVTPTQDMILGCYYLTVANPNESIGKNKVFQSVDEAILALEAKAIKFQSNIFVRVNGKRYETTIGRCIFNNEIFNCFKEFNISNTPFINEVIGKKRLSELVYGWYKEYGSQVASVLCDRLKSIGFHYSMRSGISISIDDLTVPKSKKIIIDEARAEVKKIVELEKAGKLSLDEKKNQSNEVWRAATQKVSGLLNEAMGELNNVFIMANSGARGNMDQVRQLAGMRGLMSDSQGRTVDIPIISCFKDGLTLTEYFISAYGARKGLVDTALRTADSGYLTRRLVDVAQDLIITIEDCGTKEGTTVTAIASSVETIVNLADMLEGRVSMENVINPVDKETLVSSGEIISREIAKKIQDAGISSVKCRSVFHCKAERGLCQTCYGMDLSTARQVNLGEAVGIVAAQSIGEPGTQLTMRTFHTGGVDLRKASRIEIRASQDGILKFGDTIEVSKITEDDGNTIWVSVKEDGLAFIENKDIVREIRVPQWAEMQIKPNQNVKKGDIIATYDPSYNCGVAEFEGVVKILGVTESDISKDNLGNISSKSGGEIFVYNPENIIECSVAKSVADECVIGKRVTSELVQNSELQAGGLVVAINKDENSKKSEQYQLKVCPGQAYPFHKGANIFVNNGEKVKKIDILFREKLSGSDSSKTQDIVQGLPRVEELFEARKPKDAAILSEIDGVVDVINHDYHITVSVTNSDGARKEYKLPRDSHLKVYAGKNIERGDQLNEGGVNPHDISETKGIVAAQEYLAEEVQRVYRSQGVQINGKHIEVIIRQMTKKVTVTDMGDSTLLLNEMIDIRSFNKINDLLEMEGKEKAKGVRVLLGITRASINTNSFISAASFQQTASVLTKAALEGQADPMTGLKENVIIGKLIPAGTGLPNYKRVSITTNNTSS